MNTSVDNYFIEGCGRCPLGGTPNCKVHQWVVELKLLRTIALDCGLEETTKWGVPCYMHQNKNVLIISAFKDHCVLSFFKGALLNDVENILEKPGKNSQAARILKFTDSQTINKLETTLKAYIYEAIEVEKAGLKVPFKKNPEPIPEELQQKLDEDPILKTAFETLTPGRQRGYILHFLQPKQSKTRIARIEKCTPMILNGTGLHDKYSSKRK
ncbi:YdeI/OmpD-associated family protein [Allomuricauda sp. d1]|uniref:YdeI/OmpD-associated family protein n=1 Tax=Allomuricauda sp. d1 TaxID=3136725 RepID=UPI0031DE2969